MNLDMLSSNQPLFALILSLSIGTVFVSASLLIASMGAEGDTSKSDIVTVTKADVTIAGKRIDGFYDYFGGLLPCSNPIETRVDDNMYYTCTQSYNGTRATEQAVINLSYPVYKRVQCTSTYGCGQSYNYVAEVPEDLLSPEQKEMVLQKVLNLPEVKEGGLQWEIDRFIIQPYNGYKWSADIQLFVDGISRLPPSQECRWYGSVNVDLETLQVRGIGNIPPPLSAVKC